MTSKLPGPTTEPRRTPLAFVKLAAFALFLVFLIVPIALHTPIYSNVVLYPTANTSPVPDSKQLQAKEYFFPNKAGKQLNGWFFPVAGTNKICIVHHGNAGNISNRLALAQLYASLGASTFLYDYQGFGKSAGKPELKSLIEDGQSAYDYVHDKLGFKSQDILHHGESIGSGVACAVAGTRPGGGLILEAAIGSLPSVGRYHFSFLRPYADFFFPDPQLNNVEHIKSINVPVLLMHGDADRTVPWQHSQAIYNNATGHKKLVIFHGYDHNSIDPSNPELISGLRALINGTF